MRHAEVPFALLPKALPALGCRRESNRAMVQQMHYLQCRTCF